MRSGELCWCRGFRGIVAPRRSARLRVRSAMMIQVSRKKWQEEILLPIGGSERRSEHCSLILQGCPEVALGQNVKYLSFVWTALKKTQRCQRICHKLCGIFSQNYMTTHVSTKQIHHSFGVEFFFFFDHLINVHPKFSPFSSILVSTNSFRKYLALYLAKCSGMFSSQSQTFWFLLFDARKVAHSRFIKVFSCLPYWLETGLIKVDLFLIYKTLISAV